MPPFEMHLFFCLNERAAQDPRGSCIARGSRALHAYAKEKVLGLGLAGRVRVNQAGCLDACLHGPSVVIYPDAVWYQIKSQADVDAIFKEHIVGGKPVERLRMKLV